MAKVLLVDDDRELLQIAGALLSHAQFDVTCSENAVDAMEHVRRETFDVVITDANMTPHSGFDLIRSIKLLPQYDLVPVAMLTGRREKRDVERALSVGAQDYIVKPLDPDLFIKKVSELAMRSLDNHRAAKFAEVPLNEIATCELALVVIGLTEHGALLDSDHALRVGSIVTLDCDVFHRIGTPKPQVRIISCSPGPTENTFEVRTSFHALDEKNLMKIRHYVQARALQHKKQKAS